MSLHVVVLLASFPGSRGVNESLRMSSSSLYMVYTAGTHVSPISPCCFVGSEVCG